MPFPLEAVPNFSEGRDQTTIDALAEALGARARLLDIHSDPDHNRSVFTLAGSEQELIAVLLAGAAVARDRIDMRLHDGVHPCVGVADVLPIVAVRPEDAERAKTTALELAERIGAELELPVFLYGDLAAGRTLAELRRGGVEGLAHRIESGEIEPDFGPSRLDPCSGAALVGARHPLIAFNVNLRGGLELAREIAGLVRESGGGFAGVRALGLELGGFDRVASRALGAPLGALRRRGQCAQHGPGERSAFSGARRLRATGRARTVGAAGREREIGLVQVSMNIEDWRESGLGEIVARIEREAARRGAEIVGSELVGLLPAGAATEAEQAGLLFDRSQILELRLVQTLDGERD